MQQTSRNTDGMGILKFHINMFVSYRIYSSLISICYIYQAKVLPLEMGNTDRTCAEHQQPNELDQGIPGKRWISMGKADQRFAENTPWLCHSGLVLHLEIK